MKHLVPLSQFLITIFALIALTGCEVKTPVALTAVTTEEETTAVTTESVAEATTEATTVAAPKETTLPVEYFSDLKEKNNDFVGWLNIGGTNIDAPLLRYTDNDYYLSRDFNGKSSQSGSIYIDYKNLGYFNDRHLAVYGHYMNDGTIFHDLHQYKAFDFYQKNPYVTISSLNETYVYEIFSVQIVSAYDYYLYFDLDDDAWLEYANHFSRKSIHKKDLVKPELLNDPERLKMVTFVTCTYEFDNARLLIHGYQLEKTEMPVW